MIARWEAWLGLPPGEIDARPARMDERLSAAGKDGATGTCAEDERLAVLRPATGMDDAQMDAVKPDYWDIDI
jgi:hypothetical protein